MEQKARPVLVAAKRWLSNAAAPVRVATGAIVLIAGGAPVLFAQETPPAPTEPSASAGAEAEGKVEAKSEAEVDPDPKPKTLEAASTDPPPRKPLPDPKGATRMHPKARVWTDRKQGHVLVDGEVTLREGVLEMFACPRNTKEHESIVATDSPAFLVHGALLSVGAKPGRPVRWEPRYAPPRGDRIDITVRWRKGGTDDGPMQSIDARSWVRNLRDKKAMQQHWVFAGSGFWKDDQTGREYYLAESGDMICVSNFGSAMLDIPDNSPASAEGLLFEAFTERIPPVGTPVRLVLTPKGRAKRAPGPEQPPKQGKESSQQFLDSLTPPKAAPAKDKDA